MKRILVIDSDRQSIEKLSRLLSAEGLSVQVAGDSESALHKIRAWKPQLIFLDLLLPDAPGLELIAKLRAAADQEYVSIVLMSALLPQAEVIKAIELGADDYLPKPVVESDLAIRMRVLFRIKEVYDALQRADDRIEELTSTDELTGLSNFRTLYRKGEEEILRSRRFRKPISAIMVNLDGFAKVNQDYGFLFGTHVLQEVSKRLKACIRNIDMIARIGADEYFILLLETDLAGAEFVAERVRDAISSQVYRTDKLTAKLTASMGVAGIRAEQQDAKMSDLMHSSSEALRSAKAAGPNKIEVYSFA